MNHRTNNRDDTVERLGGIGAVASGVTFLLTLLYTFGFLARLGLSVEMLDAPSQLLPWIEAHAGAYLGLWWIYLVSLLFLLPVPWAVRRRAMPYGPARALLGSVAGASGIGIGLAAAATIAASAPLLGQAYVVAGAAERSGVLLLSEVFGSLGLHLRLVSELLIGIWLGTTGWVLLRGGSRWRTLGAALIGVAGVVLVVVVAKPLALFDGEPFLGMLLALAYLWLGIVLLREREGAGDQRLPDAGVAPGFSRDPGARTGRGSNGAA